MPVPGTDKIMHACFSIGGSKIFVADEAPQRGSTAPSLGAVGARFYVYFDDVDAVHKRALAAGMAERSPPADVFWGNRISTVADRFGQIWTLAAHVRDVSAEELKNSMKEMAKG